MDELSMALFHASMHAIWSSHRSHSILILTKSEIRWEANGFYEKQAAQHPAFIYKAMGLINGSIAVFKEMIMDSEMLFSSPGLAGLEKESVLIVH